MDVADFPLPLTKERVGILKSPPNLVELNYMLPVENLSLERRRTKYDKRDYYFQQKEFTTVTARLQYLPPCLHNTDTEPFA